MTKKKMMAIVEPNTDHAADEFSFGSPDLRVIYPGGLMVAICTLGKVRTEWAAAFATATPPFGVMKHTAVFDGYSTGEARNKAVEECIEKNLDYLMFWDDDMLPHRRYCLEHMYAAMLHHPEIDVLGAVYPVRRHIPDPVVLENPGSGAYWGWQDGKIHKVYMTGTGFTIYRMNSLKDIPRPWFTEKTEASDDFYFAQLCADHGKSIYIDGAVVCNQISLDGQHIFNVYDAIPEVAKPGEHVEVGRVEGGEGIEIIMPVALGI